MIRVRIRVFNWHSNHFDYSANNTGILQMDSSVSISLMLFLHILNDVGQLPFHSFMLICL